MRWSQDLQVEHISNHHFPRTTAVVQWGEKTEVASGIIGGLWSLKEPDRFYGIVTGQTRFGDQGLPCTIHTSFDVSSISKVISTAALTGALIDRRWLTWDTPVAAFFPGIKHLEDIKIWHLLSHSAGYVAWKPYWEEVKTACGSRAVYEVPVEQRQAIMRKLVLATVPDVRPGVKSLYSDLSSFLLGFCLEEILQESLDRAVEKSIWAEMGMEHTHYHRVTRHPLKDHNPDIAATEDSAWRGGLLQGQVHDDNCWAMGGYSGNAGAFSTVGDLFKFVRAFFQKFFNLDTVAKFSSLVKLETPTDRTFGWDTPAPQGSMVGRFFSPHTIGHWGYTGTSLWIDLEREVAIALLTNRVHPTRENEKIREFRPKFHDAIWEDWFNLKL